MADTQRMDYASARLECGEDIDEKGIMIAIVSTATDGECYKADTTANSVVVGVNQGVGDEGDYIVVESGIFLFDNGTTACDQNDIGATAYVEDEHTVASDNTDSIIAGTIVDVVSAGVWVKIGV